MNKTHWLLLTLTLSARLSQAADGHHGGEGVPTFVYWQAANLIVIAIGLYFMLGKKATGFFASKKQDFLNTAEKSKKIREEAEHKVKDIQARLQKLESTSAESLERARAESADLKKQLVSEAQALAQRIKSEAAEASKSEVLRAQRELHKEVATEAVRMAREVLKKDTSQADQNKLQERFSQEIDGVKL